MPTPTPPRPTRVAVIGAGPSGFFAIAALLNEHEGPLSIDLFDRLPTPYGLVRFGVAPDHEKIRNVTRLYDKSLADERVRFFGNVELGRDLTREELRRHYDAIVYAIGTPSERDLGLPGERLEGSHSATAFVGWYNGHPDYCHLDFPLERAERVIVVGAGNVAMDVVRILAKPVEELATTDIADHALARLRASGVRHITLLARRGPVQAAFTNPELRELGELEGVQVTVDPGTLALDPVSEAMRASSREAKRNMETLRQFAERIPLTEPRVEIALRFSASPVELLGEGRLEAVRIEENELVPTDAGDTVWARGSERFEALPADMIFRAIGYRGVALPGLPFDARRGRLPNVAGRLTDEAGEVQPGEYVVGWAKRGPSGVIGTNKPDAVESVRQLLADLPELPQVPDAYAVPESIEGMLRGRGVRLVDRAGWDRINAAECARGAPAGRPRIRFTTVEEMLAAAADGEWNMDAPRGE